MATRLKPLDASWLLVDTRDTPMHVASLTIYSLPPDAGDNFVQDLVAHLRSSRTFVPPFNQKLASSPLKNVLPAWIEDHKIDIDYHLRHSALPRPGGERELGVLVSRLHSNQMDFNRPLWECHIIEGLENGRFAMYVKMHHSLVDGVGGMRLMQKMLSTSPDERDLPPPWSFRGGEPRAARARVPLVENLKRAFDQQVQSVPGLAKAFRNLAQAYWDRPKDEALPFIAPRSVLNGKVSGQRRFATQAYTLERIKKLAKALDATVNDVFLAMCGGALRRYLEEIQALPDQPLTAGIPVSVRPQGGEDAGNAISFIVSTLATHVADPLERLAAIKESTASAKSKLQELPKVGINNYTMILMAPYIVQMLTGLGGRSRPMFNVTISNVPGPQQAMYFNGAKMEQMYPVSLLSHGQALNITVVSYDGQFNVGFTGCRDTLPHMQKLSVYTGEALEELEGLAKKRRSRAA